MRTEDLIRALASDAGDEASTPLGATLALGLLPAVALSAVVFVSTLGMRPHLLALATEPRILFKLLFPLGLAACASVTVLRLARPGSDLRICILLLALAALAILGAVVSELVVVPQDLWKARLIGHNAMICLKTIPALSVVPLLAAFLVMRKGAATRPALAGASIGLFASAIGAAIYAMHCPDDSPLFVAAWYGLAIAAMALVGAIAGARFLRW